MRLGKFKLALDDQADREDFVGPSRHGEFDVGGQRRQDNYGCIKTALSCSGRNFSIGFSRCVIILKPERGLSAPSHGIEGRASSATRKGRE
jgi:hypothetical protein